MLLICLMLIYLLVIHSTQYEKNILRIPFFNMTMINVFATKKSKKKVFKLTKAVKFYLFYFF